MGCLMSAKKTHKISTHLFCWPRKYLLPEERASENTGLTWKSFCRAEIMEGTKGQVEEA